MTDGLAGLRVEQLTVKDALDLAILIEEEARERYEALSRQVGGRYAGDAADMFLAMAANEAKHGAQLSERRRRLFGEGPTSVTRDMIFEVEAPGLGSARVFMSARQAMEVALASEQKAREFFEDALRGPVEAEVRSLFQELREEEVEHERLVRARMARLPPGPDLAEEDADEPGNDPGN